ncbi:MAG: pyrimidine-nucleoside phosphorylase [Chloroflexota bacterium]
MRAVDIIAKKREGEKLTAQEIDWFVQGFTRGDLPDYQAAAWLMAIYLRGMDHDETVALTLSMAHSGKMLDLGGIAPLVVDKHSTGGVGDKTTLVVAPLAAAAGLPVGKMSGRGLGFSGGTLDKLEAIRGYRADLTTAEFLTQLRQHGIVVAGQSADLAPADGKFYALRDVTATVSSLPLIAASIMSKKIAAGAGAIVLDVKVGRGAFMKTEADARALAGVMVEMGKSVGRRVVAVISDMSQPLGFAVGNALEVREAIDTLHGRGPVDFREHCLEVATHMLLLADPSAEADAARHRLQGMLENGKAWEKFREWIAAQGGDLAVPDEPERLPQARLIKTVTAPADGYVAAIDAMEIGTSCMLLGAGRAKKGATIDPAVGIVLAAKVGDRVAQGEPLFTLHANDQGALAEAERRVLGAFALQDEPAAPLPFFYGVVD